jgi:hypothetical protein
MTIINSNIIIDLIRESNKIEGIIREPHLAEVTALAEFLELDYISVGQLITLTRAMEPTASPRFNLGMDVRVGTHLPPNGGVGVMYRLDSILTDMYEGHGTPYENHLAYETLHPFTDGNGRSGRALWAWQMIQKGQSGWLNVGFLHSFYYQALSAGQGR